MGVFRDSGTLDNTVSYVATLAFFCCVSCVSLMLKFGGFKATFNLYNGKVKKAEKELYDSDLAGVSITGAYRTNRDEFFGYNYPEAQRKITPSIVPVTSTEKPQPLRQVKSASDLVKNKNLPPKLQQEQPGISRDPRGAEQYETRNNKNQEKDPKTEKVLDAQKRVDKQKLAEQNKKDKQRREEQKKLDKQRIEEEKKRIKLAAQEQAKQEKLKKEKDRKEAAKAKKDKKTQRPLANPLAQTTAAASNNPLAQRDPQYTTNTLESSISKSSGPPPYSQMPKSEQENDSSGNVSYSKPIDTGSWDMITKHRENISKRPISSPMKQAKQTMMDLNYKVDEGNVNSEA